MAPTLRQLMIVGLTWLTLSSPLLAAPASPSPAPAPGAPSGDANPFAGAPGKKEYPDATAIILKDDIQATVNADGSHDLVEYDAIKLLDPAGIERFAHQTRLYDSKTETIEVPLARMWSPDGKMTVLPASAITDSIPEGLARTALYQRVHQLSLDYRDAIEGSIVEFRIVHHRKTPYFGKKFWEISYTQDFEPILDTQFTFNSPDRMAVDIATPGMASLQPEQVQRTAGRTTMRWHMKDRPALLHQPAMPPLRSLATQIQVSNFSNWDDFGNWARAQWDAAVQPDAGINARSASLTAGQASDEVRIRSIMAWIDKEKKVLVSDVSLEDLAPTTATQAFHAAELLPQDRAVLLVSMLRAVNIRAFPAMVATSDYGDPSRGVPSLQQFNRVLVVVAMAGGGWRWLDPMASTPGVLGQGLDDRPAFVLNGGSKMVSTETTAPQLNREEIDGEARLDTDGSMETVLKLSEYGAKSMLWRAMAASSSTKEQQKIFQILVAEINQSATLRDFFIPPVTDGPLQLTLGFEETRAGTKVPGGDGFQFTLPLLPQDRMTSYARLSATQRKYPLVLGSTTYEERRLRIVLPAGWTVKSLPHSVARNNSVGSYQADVRSDDHTIYFYSRLIVRRTDIPVADYPQFKELMEQVSATNAEHVVLSAAAAKP